MIFLHNSSVNLGRFFDLVQRLSFIGCKLILYDIIYNKHIFFSKDFYADLEKMRILNLWCQLNNRGITANVPPVAGGFFFRSGPPRQSCQKNPPAPIY
jgi:hypothetical protein